MKFLEANFSGPECMTLGFKAFFLSHVAVWPLLKDLFWPVYTVLVKLPHRSRWTVCVKTTVFTHTHINHQTIIKHIFANFLFFSFLWPALRVSIKYLFGCARFNFSNFNL